MWAYHRGVSDDAVAVLTSPADMVELVSREYASPVAARRPRDAFCSAC